MLFLKAAGALAAAALIGSAACAESPEALDLSSPESEEFYAESAASRGAAAPAPTLKERLQALQDELRAWQEAQQTKMKASHDELVALWRAAAAAAQERIRLSHQMQALKKEAVKDLLEAFFEWLRKLVSPTSPRPFPPARPYSTDTAAAAADAEAVEEAETRKEADKGLRQEAEALLQAIQEILQQGCGKDDEDDDKQQQQGQQQGGSDAAGPAPSQPQAPEQQQQPGAEQEQEQQQQEQQQQEQQQQEQQQETVDSVVRGSEQPKKGGSFFALGPQLSFPLGGQTPEKPQSGEGQQQEQQKPEQQPQQPEIEQVGPEIPGHQPGSDEQPIDPEFSYPAPEPEFLPEQLPLQLVPGGRMLLINMHTALLGAAVTESVYKTNATVNRLSAAAAAAAAGGGTVIAAGPFRGSSSSSDATKAQGAQQILQELQDIKSGLDDMNQAAAAEFAACDDANEQQRLRVLKNWLVGINVFQVKLLHLSAMAQQLGIQTDSVPIPPIAQGYPLPRPQEAKTSEYEYAIYPSY